MISIVSTYKNRREHIEKSLPTWLSQRNKLGYEIIIVDYDSDDDVSDLFKKISCNTSIFHVKCLDLPIFHLSHARNIGSLHANGDILFFLDIDTLLAEDAIRWLELSCVETNKYFAAVDAGVRKEIVNGGLIAVNKSAHDKVCGFNENIKGWGFEDIDYKRRLEQIGLSYHFFPHVLYECIEHGDLYRTQNYKENKEVSWTKNRQISLRTWNSSSFGICKSFIINTYDKTKNV